MPRKTHPDVHDDETPKVSPVGPNCARIDVDAPFDFDRDDLAPRSKEVKYAGRTYLLREAGKGAADAYRNSVTKAARMNDSKLVGIDGLASGEAALLAACLFELVPNKNGDGGYREGPVGEGFVRSLPFRFAKPMFEWVKKYSDLGEEDTEDGLAREEENIKKRRAALAESKDGTTGPKGSPPFTTGHSDTAPE